MRTIDLHTHSNKSDGSMTPSELVRHAKKQGLTAIALSDHDGIDGVQEAYNEGKKIGLEVVPAVELSAQSETETHILGYYIDIYNPILTEKLAEIKQKRIERNADTAANLQAYGFDITLEDAAEFAGSDMLGRAHFAKAMVKKGYADSVQDAFDRFLSYGKPCYSKRQLLTDKECISLINTAGGLAFCAHLHLMKKSDEDLYDFLKDMKTAGLCGIEGYYTDYTTEMGQKYRSFAKELGLELSGGTDFHGEMKPHIAIGKGRGSLTIPYSVLERIKEVKKSRS
ncbi:MAG: PHP domain-containing protein [Clostridia bacterium]|nr:PHP domain-containing protein [Clostridia bacterium]